MRLGLRLTLRQNGNKPAGSQTEDQSAAGRDDDQPGASQADGASEQPGDGQTESFPAVPADSDLPAVSHEEYPPAGNESGAGADGTEAAVQAVQVDGGDQPAGSGTEEHAVESEQAVEIGAADQATASEATPGEATSSQATASEATAGEATASQAGDKSLFFTFYSPLP